MSEQQLSAARPSCEHVKCGRPAVARFVGYFGEAAYCADCMAWMLDSPPGKNCPCNHKRRRESRWA